MLKKSVPTIILMILNLLFLNRYFRIDLVACVTNNNRGVIYLLFDLSIFKRLEFSASAALEVFIFKAAATAVKFLAFVTLMNFGWNQVALLTLEALGHGSEKRIVHNLRFINVVH